MTLITLSAPAACPIDFGNDCRFDHLEFPSHIKAMCRGSSPVGELVSIVASLVFDIVVNPLRNCDSSSSIHNVSLNVCLLIPFASIKLVPWDWRSEYLRILGVDLEVWSGAAIRLDGANDVISGISNEATSMRRMHEYILFISNHWIVHGLQNDIINDKKMWWYEGSVLVDLSWFGWLVVSV